MYNLIITHNLIKREFIPMSPTYSSTRGLSCPFLLCLFVTSSTERELRGTLSAVRLLLWSPQCGCKAVL